LDEAEKIAMFELYARYYLETDWDLFRGDLDDKDQVVLLSDKRGRLQGFSTLAVFSFVTASGSGRAIFSGDTIVDRAYWGEQDLAFTWIRLAGRIKAQQKDVPLFWFLIVKGHRTYRYLSAFTNSYFPHWQRPTPVEVRCLMDDLARQRYGHHYDPRCGLIRFPTSRGQLKPTWANVSSSEMRRPEVSYFLERNPGYAQGDELVCLTELCEDNLRPLARRLFVQGMVSAR
jgi:hypothetical protein